MRTMARAVRSCPQRPSAVGTTAAGDTVGDVCVAYSVCVTCVVCIMCGVCVACSLCVTCVLCVSRMLCV